MATNLLNINNITPKTSSFDVSWNGAASLDKRYSHAAGNGATSPPPLYNAAGTGASFRYNTRRIDVTHTQASQTQVVLTTSSPHGLNVGDVVYLELYEASGSYINQWNPGYGFSNNSFITISGVTSTTITIPALPANAGTLTYPQSPINCSLFARTTDNIFCFTGDYTIEGFTSLQPFYNGSGNSYATPRWLFRATDGTNSFGARISGGLTVEVFTNSASRSANFSAGDRSCHFALVRKGSIVSFLANGYLVMSFTSSGTHGYSSAWCTTDDGLIVSNFRVTDRALYDPINMSIPVGQGSILSYDLFPKGPLTAVAGTRLLTFQDPTLQDNSGNNHVVSCVNRNSIVSGGGATLNSTTTLISLTPFSRIGGIQWTDVRSLPGTRQSILTNPVGSNKNIKINSLRIFARTNTNGYQGYYGWEIGVIDADSKANIIASSQFLKSTMNDGSEFQSTKHFIGDVIDSPIYLSPGTTLFGAVLLETYFSGTIAYEEIA